MMPSKQSTIKVVAQKLSIGIETIRYYERIGLIEKPKKPLSGYRVYPEITVTRLLFIKRAKELATHKLAIINSKLLDLQAIASTLEKLIQSCESNPAHRSCPIITAIMKK